jgi:polysaccharide export outer membrane protein
MISRRYRCAVSLVVGFGLAIFSRLPQAAGQNLQAQPPANPPAAITSVRPDYELGPNDQILIGVPQAEEINQRPFRIDSEGFINVPIIGRVHAGGLTIRSLETELTAKLREYIRQPQVTVSIVQFRSEPVFFLGAFRTPGIYPLQGGRTLVEMLAVAGGLQPTAGRRIKITRRMEYGPIPLPNAIENPDRKVSTIEISLDSLTQNINPAEDITLHAYDIVSAETAQPVYVSGEVVKPTTIELGERESISVAQAITTAGGFTAIASRNKARVLRPILGTSRRAEIEIDLNRVLHGKDNDFPLLPNDVLYVPRSSGRSVLVPLSTTMLASLPYIIVTALLR